MEKNPAFEASNDSLAQSPEVALEAGKKVIEALVDMALYTIEGTADPEVRAGLSDVLQNKLKQTADEAASSTGMSEQSEPTSLRRTGGFTGRTREEVILEAQTISRARRRGILPLRKKSKL